MLLTIFTPTYNRAHTLRRLYESLCTQTVLQNFEWLVIDDGSTDFTKRLVESFINENRIPIRYIYKENGGLYTGYNTAYANIDSELSMCVDSDDFLPDNAVEIIMNEWLERGNDNFAGLLGLDFYANTNTPIGGYFKDNMDFCWLYELEVYGRHKGDTKQILRTDLMKKFAPQLGFDGEKNFNPFYLILQVCDRYPLLVVNKNLCCVDYQIGADSMSERIFCQYIDSPRSFAKLRILQMSLKHSNSLYRFKAAIHYVSSCLISKDRKFISKSPRKIMTIFAIPFGYILYHYILYKFNKTNC